MPELPKRADVVVIGAGIAGNMLAWNLAKLGWRELVLLDQGPFPNPGGSTGHSSSMLWLPEASRELDAITAETKRAYQELGCFTLAGGIEVARTEERLEEQKRRLAMARLWGHQASLVSPEDVVEMVPYVDPAAILGGIYQPETGVIDPVEAGRLVREEAERQGALVSSPFVTIQGIDVRDGLVVAVRTSRGVIATERVVIAGGVWAARLGRMAGVSIPLTAGVVQAIHVGPLPIFSERPGAISFPIIRDVDNQLYMRQHGSSLEVGSYALTPILMDADDIPGVDAATLSPTELPMTWDDFEPSMERSLELMPAIFGHPNAEVPYAINGLVSVSADGLPILGQAPEVRGVWSVNRVDVKVAPAVARLVADWMTNGETSSYPHPYHIARFHDHERTEAHVTSRGAERFTRSYRIVHPYEEFGSARNQRLSPIHPRQLELGAVFTEQGGWEVPRWFEANRGLMEGYEGRLQPREGWEATGWSPIVSAEHLALRERAAIEDTTARGLFEVSGPGAADWLDGLVVGDLDVPDGAVVPTWMLGPNGAIGAEVTIIRHAVDRLWIQTGVARQMRDRKWLVDHLASGVALTDITSAWCSVGLWGPASSRVLAAISRSCRNLAQDPGGAPNWSVRPVEIGTVRGFAVRTPRLGDPGWELFAPMEQGLRLWDTNVEAGRPEGLVPAGFAVSSIGGRHELGLASRAWELVSGYDLTEAGLVTSPKARDFIGRAALIEQLGRDPDARLCRLVVEDHRSASKGLRYTMGGEALLTRDGDLLVDRRGRRSFATSAGSVPTAGEHRLFGYLPIDLAVEGTELAVDYFGERYPVRVIGVGAVHPAMLGS